MNHFQLKSLTFYGIAIGFVVGLFSIVTAYGEANLKTAQSIGGDYLLKLPLIEGCKEEEPVMLSIQQSGIYVAAALVNPNLKSSKMVSKPMTLSGQWQNRRINLSGKVPTNMLCAGAVANTAIAVNIEGAIAPLHPQSLHPESTPSDALTGTISLNKLTTSLTAQRQPTPKIEQK
jgi:hypothetical protein